jgi:hypothetical protein
MNRDLYNDLVRLSTDKSLSERFRRECRIELGDLPAVGVNSLWDAAETAERGVK